MTAFDGYVASFSSCKGGGDTGGQIKKLVVSRKGTLKKEGAHEERI